MNLDEQVPGDRVLPALRLVSPVSAKEKVTRTTGNTLISPSPLSGLWTDGHILYLASTSYYHQSIATDLTFCY